MRKDRRDNIIYLQDYFEKNNNYSLEDKIERIERLIDAIKKESERLLREVEKLRDQVLRAIEKFGVY